ncbi:hypothetical protein QC764_303630 [Podospora pseudoanserina]|uniref:Transglutaminase-like domain-containing protein n=1 Tax=Podospora pseudoanserina TaxID=2609844 RepID=A0ABR0ICB1_9PEZI|nr:hypothetical protein QC764_303630 [Podospora pseudoanserina]
MADVEEPRFNSLAERIAALNAQKNFQAPPSTAGKRPPPPPPPVRAATITTTTTTPSPSSQQPQNETAPVMPPRPVRASTEKLPPPLPRRTTTDIEKGDRPAPGPGLGRVLPPPLPSRDSSSAKGTPPALPSRRPSSNLTLPTPGGRRNSNSSDISYISTMSSLSLNQDGPTPRRGLPPPLEQAKLPPLPPTRRELEAKAKEEAANTPPLPRRVTEPPPQAMPELPSGRPSLPPRLPSRPAKSPLMNATEAPSPSLPARRLPPPPSSYKNPKSALELGFNNKPRPADDVPPPIPLASRPSISQIEAVRSASTPSPTAAAAAASSSSSSSPPSCLVCRDFSGPDTVAAQHPYTSLPRQDPISYLAHHLCSPFPSPTDKARAIFTWCHHNIAYDVHGFFNNCIPRGLTPAETIFSGKAVCEGYARVYEAIARAAGLHCIVVGGHGKGYGFSALKKGERCPPKDPTGHAWNAVMIDNDEWKLIDPCWGAGHLDGGTNGYKKQFSPGQFARSNEFFGRSHYPSDERHFHRRDGRVPSWEEYILGETGGEEPAGWMGDAEREGGLDQSNFEPKQKEICVSGAGEGSVTRFQFGKVCPHWVSEKHGRGRQMLICLVFGEDEKRAGGKERFVPLETDGFWWWLDVRTRDLGGVGKRVRLVGITTVDGRDARGLTGEEFKGVVGRKAFAMCGMVDWVLV